jgi:hypothetical protein
MRVDTSGLPDTIAILVSTASLDFWKEIEEAEESLCAVPEVMMPFSSYSGEAWMEDWAFEPLMIDDWLLVKSLSLVT